MPSLELSERVESEYQDTKKLLLTQRGIASMSDSDFMEVMLIATRQGIVAAEQLRRMGQYDDSLLKRLLRGR